MVPWYVCRSARRPFRERSASTAGGDASPSAFLSQYPSPPTSALTKSRPFLRTVVSASSLDFSQAEVSASPPPSSSDPNRASCDSRRIRFAPLPKSQRPRRFSTGRDVWIEGDGHLSLTGPGLYRETWAVGSLSSTSLNDSCSGSADISFSPSFPARSMSDSSYLAAAEESLPSSYNYAPSSHSGSHRRGATLSSATDKFLHSLSFGRLRSKEGSVKRKSSSDVVNISPSPTSGRNLDPEVVLAGGEALSRRISTGGMSWRNALEQQRAADFRSSGVPMRRTTTQDSDRPRLAYPSIAQNSLRRLSIGTKPEKSEPEPEPEFMEWSNPSATCNPNEGEDDGSGIAWLKKRRRKREIDTRKEQEQATEDAIHQMEKVSPQKDGLQKFRVEAVPAQSTSHGIAIRNAVYSAVTAISEGRTADAAAELDTADEIAEEEDADAEEEEEGDINGDALEDEGEDLTTADIEEEERLAEEARKTTGGAGKEKYHDHDHKSFTHHVEAPKNKVKSPALSRSSTTTSLAADVLRIASPPNHL